MRQQQPGSIQQSPSRRGLRGLWTPLAVATFLAWVNVIAFFPTVHAQQAEPQADPNACYGFAAGNDPSKRDNLLVRINYETGAVIQKIGSDPTVHDIEAMAFAPGGITLYAPDDRDKAGGFLGTLSLKDGKFTQISPSTGIGKGNGAQGSLVMGDIDGLTYDATEQVLYAALRRSNDKDVLFKINPQTGTLIADAFGAGKDYVPITGSKFADIDDITIHPVTEELYGIANTSGSPGELVKINKHTGQVTVLGNFSVADMEGLSFFNNGALYASTGSGGKKNSGTLYRIDQTVIQEIKVGPFNTPGITDYEAIGCLTARVVMGLEKTTNGVDADTPAGAVEVSVGSPITWTYVLRNTGVVTLTNLLLIDDKEGIIATPPTLAPNEVVTYTRTGIAKEGLYINTAIVTGVPTIGPANPVIQRDSSHYLGIPTGFGIIGDRVWSDNNRNGQQDNGEAGITGVTLTLFNQANSVVASTQTNIDGLYHFDNLTPGTYRVEVNPVTLPPNLEPSYDSDPPHDHKATFTLKANENRDDLDFGYQPLYHTIAGRLWFDENGDTVQDNEIESGIPGVTVELMGSTSSLVSSQVTDANGRYHFADLPPGTYIVSVVTTTLPANLAPTYDFDGIPYQQAAVTVGPSRTDVDFGYRSVTNPTNPNSIGDLLWYDSNGNGGYESTEVGIGGVTIRLVGNNGIMRMTQTDLNGRYHFNLLPTGIYTVTVDSSTLSPGLQPTYDPDLVLDHQTVVTVSVNDNRNDIDFGYRFLTGSLGDLVWSDANGNGVHDASERGLPAIGLVLVDNQGFTFNTSTDSDGSYHFTDLAPGAYTVTVDIATLPPGSQLTYDPRPPFDHRASILLQPNQQITDLDFGYQVPGTGSICGLVWFDTNGNGLLDDPESSIPNVGLTLSGNNLIANTSTASNGQYQFVNLFAGHYTVTLDPSTLPVPVSQSYVQEVDLGSGAKVCADFGIVPTVNAAIRGLLWNDTDGNSLHDNGESGLTNVGLTLRNNHGFMDTTATDGVGSYVFINLAAGLYTVTVDISTLPANSKLTYDPDGTLDHLTHITLNSGLDVNNVNFGYQVDQAPLPPLDLETFINGEDADTPPGPKIVVSRPVTWRYALTNRSEWTLKDISVSDDNGTPTNPGDDSLVCIIPVLTLGSSTECTATGTAQLGQQSNIGIATGQPVDANGVAVGQPVSDTDPSYYVGVSSPITVTPHANGLAINHPPGICVQTPSSIQWTYVITNVGQDRIRDIRLTDAQNGEIHCSPNVLEPSAVLTCSASSSAVIGDVSTTVQVSGQPVDSLDNPIGGRVQAEAKGYYFGRHTEMLVEKLVNGAEADAFNDKWLPLPNTATFTYWITNTGETRLVNLAVTDSDPSLSISCLGAQLGPGESLQCTATTPAILGDYFSEGIFTAQPLDEQNTPCGAPVRLTDPVYYRGFNEQNPFTLELEPDAADRDVGTTHTVTATVRNRDTGQVLVNAPIHFVVDSQSTQPVVVNTNGTGQAVFPYFGGINLAATHTISAWLELNNNQVFDPFGPNAEPLDQATVNWRPITVAICHDVGGTVANPVRQLTVKVVNASAGGVAENPEEICDPQKPPVLGVRVGISVTGGTHHDPEFQTIEEPGMVTFVYTSTAPRPAAAQVNVVTTAEAAQIEQVQEDTDLVNIWVELNGNDRLDAAEPFDLAEVTTAIGLVGFTAQAESDQVRLRWSTAVEIDHAGFNLYRARTAEGDYSLVNSQFIGAQGEGYGASYEFVDVPPEPGQYYYKLEAVSNHNVRDTYPPQMVWFAMPPPSDPANRIYLPVVQN